MDPALEGSACAAEGPVVSILFVNHNSGRFLADCIDSLKSHVSAPHEIIVVDNASTDGSIPLIRSRFPEARLIENDLNLGFAAANNLGARAARGRYLLLLNPDTVLLSDILPALELLERAPETGVVGAKMAGADGAYRYSAGFFPFIGRLFRLSSLYRKDGPFMSGDFPPGRSYPIDWVEASFLLTRKSIWDTLGGMDEGYFMYGEDVDFCYRVWNAGFSNSFCPDVEYTHFGGFTDARIPQLMKGFVRFHRKFSAPLYRRAVVITLLTGLCLRLVASSLLLALSGASRYRTKSLALIEAIKGVSA